MSAFIQTIRKIKGIRVTFGGHRRPRAKPRWIYVGVLLALATMICFINGEEGAGTLAAVVMIGFSFALETFPEMREADKSITSGNTTEYQQEGVES
jgi:hypothetical protein